MLQKPFKLLLQTKLETNDSRWTRLTFVGINDLNWWNSYKVSKNQHEVIIISASQLFFDEEIYENAASERNMKTKSYCLHLFCHFFADSVHPSSWNTIFICWYKESNFLFISKLLCCFFFVSISSDAGKRFSILSNKSWIWRRGKFSKKLEINLWQIFWMTFISVLPLDWRI